MEEQYMSLITEYIDGSLSEESRKEFDAYVTEGHIDMHEVEALAELQGKMITAPEPIPTDAMSEGFYSQLNAAKVEQSTDSGASKWEVLWQMILGTNRGRLAFGMAVLVFGIVIGRTLTGSFYQNQLTDLSAQMVDMKEMMMMTMLEEESVTKRLKGVQMSSELVSTNAEVTDAMFMTLNSDESTNVRMAALNLLAQYADDPAIREGLINSISQQESPLMQVALAELMVELQESKAVSEFKNIIEGEYTPEEVKTTLRESVNKIM
ncbi:HEAT repeat domain-containing protein [Roseivirga misakiensis]|uniref:HEAT repeat domain-containing protein n=1 Tax=Roseivirga misakiensis TaxID=1563681 RepID=A0A1E5T4H1_9BACT|nr:HEAT repeat domain-containing protein [Roseivirga misakiensis]OEK06275.1 hypothetical protein BFP71_00945 [Roseivirga misakiensis]